MALYRPEKWFQNTTIKFALRHHVPSHWEFIGQKPHMYLGVVPVWLAFVDTRLSWVLDKAQPGWISKNDPQIKTCTEITGSLQ